MYTADKKKTGAMTALIEAGANVNIVDRVSAFLFALLMRARVHPLLPLFPHSHVCTRCVVPTQFAPLLLMPQQDGLTALHYAAHSGNKDAVQLLLNASADKDLKSKDGKTCLDEAEERGHKAIAALLKGEAYEEPAPEPEQPPPEAPKPKEKEPETPAPSAPTASDTLAADESDGAPGAAEDPMPANADVTSAEPAAKEGAPAAANAEPTAAASAPASSAPAASEAEPAAAAVAAAPAVSSGEAAAEPLAADAEAASPAPVAAPAAADAVAADSTAAPAPAAGTESEAVRAAAPAASESEAVAAAVAAPAPEPTAAPATAAGGEEPVAAAAE